MKLWLWSFSVLATAFVLAILYYMSGLIIFAGRTASDFNRPELPPCNDWHRNFTYADRRLADHNSGIEIPDCEETQAMPRESHFIENNEGLTIHYLSFPAQKDLQQSTPVWLHIHGITSSWLHGARYLEAADRLGFRLLLIELQNHGRSARHSAGAAWGCREKWDMLAILEQIKSLYPQAPTMVTATSMGTAVTTQAAIENPEAFSQVKALIYESPVSSPNFILEMWKKTKGFSDGFTQIFWAGLTELAKFRSPVDFDQCHHELTASARMVEIPTLLQLSMDEHKSAEIREMFDTYPKHQHIEVKVYPRGTHSAFWNYQPAEFEADILKFFQQAQQGKN
ncbi:MAG: alpha/beta hydrolase [Oligoflexus sp.]